LLTFTVDEVEIEPARFSRERPGLFPAGADIALVNRGTVAHTERAALVPGVPNAGINRRFNYAEQVQPADKSSLKPKGLCRLVVMDKRNGRFILIGTLARFFRLPRENPLPVIHTLRLQI